MKKQRTRQPTAEQIEYFEKCLEEYQAALNLRDWRIERTNKWASKGCMAEVNISSEDKLASWAIGKDWGPTEINENSLRETALHELLHVALRPLIDAAINRDQKAIETAEHSLIVVLTKLLS